MEWDNIKSNAEYIEALKRLILIMDAEPGSKESKESATLQTLLKKYEKKHVIYSEQDLMHDY